VTVATLKQKIMAETRMRELLEDNGLPPPDAVEYGFTCIRLLWHEQKAVVVVDIDELGEKFGWDDPTLDDASGSYSDAA
jgi:hypothetical protein